MSNWHVQETYKSLIQIGNGLLRFILIVNGGAALAVMAFIGTIYPLDNGYPNVLPSLSSFLIGIFFAGLAHYTAYRTQLKLYQEGQVHSKADSSRSHTFWLNLSGTFVIISIIFFGIGAFCGVSSIIPSN